MKYTDFFKMLLHKESFLTCFHQYSKGNNPGDRISASSHHLTPTVDLWVCQKLLIMQAFD